MATTLEGVAAIGTTAYETLQLAIDAVLENELTTVYLLKDTNEDIVTLENQKIILNLRGYTVNNASGTTLTTASGTEVQVTNGIVDNSITSGSYAAIEVLENSTVSISNVEIDSSLSNSDLCGVWVYEDGKFEMNS